MVRTVKRLMKYEDDPYLALLNYRAMPLPWCSLSPSQLLMGRRIRTPVPQVKEHFIPDWSHLTDFRSCDTKYKENKNDCMTVDTESVN